MGEEKKRLELLNGIFLIALEPQGGDKLLLWESAPRLEYGLEPVILRVRMIFSREEGSASYGGGGAMK